MGPALSPGAVGQEMAACAVLGGVLGAARAVLPTRGRAAFLPDMLFVGAVLMALQSYAVSQSQAGQLRGYLALAAFCAAGAVSYTHLSGDTKKGFRPSFIKAARPPLAVDAYELFLAEMNKQGLKDVQHGEFGADMQVSLVNEGPCTIVIDTDEWHKGEK